MCDRCVELQARVRELEFEVAHTLDWKLVGEIRRALKLEPQASRFVALLYKAKGVLDRDRLETTIQFDYAKELSDKSNIISVYVSKVRNKLGNDFIENVYGRGWYMSDKAKAKLTYMLAML